MDLLAAIASDPTVVPLWGVALFAVGMYPVGMLFGCRPCCEVCKSCCRDEVGQVVIDFALEGTGIQTVKETPFERKSFNNGGNFEVDGTETAPMFIVTGQTSGARHLFPARVNGDGTFSPHFLGMGIYSAAMGNRAMSEFQNGEAVTVAPFPAGTLVESANLSAVVPDCPEDTSGNNVPPVSFTGTPGRWEAVTPAVDLTVDCQADEGTVIFDVEAHDNRQPEYCDTCAPTVVRAMAHPASFLLDPCTSGAQPPIHQLQRERSVLEVAVNLMAYGPKSADNCGDELAAVATQSWGGITGYAQNANAFCTTETTYTLAPDDQDCVPFSAWAEDTVTTGPGEYVEDLITLTATSCYGSGFSGKATLPEGVPGVDDGPIAAVEVTDGGSGYAVLGRVEPTIDISSDNGTGAELVVTWTEGDDDCGRPVWSVDSVSIGSGSGDDGGAGYVHDELLEVTIGPPGVEVTPAVLRVVSGREEPEVTASSNGSGASLSFTFTQNAGSPPTWSVDTVTVVTGGSGYAYGDIVYFDPATAADFEALFGFGLAVTSVSQPTVLLFGGTGTSADLAVTLASNGGAPETWGISLVSITNGGAGYLVGDQLSVDIAVGDVEVVAAVVTVSSVSGTGAITGLSIGTAGQYYHEDGTLLSVTVSDAGAYWRATGEIESVTVEEAGSYYEESETEPALVSDLTIEIYQKPPSDGSGATISAVVDDDPASATFGHVTGLTIDAGGDGYLAIHHEDGVCAGPGGVYRDLYIHCGITQGDPDVSGRGLLFRRGCPDYTYDITIQAPAS